MSSSGGEMGRFPTGTVPPTSPFRSGATVAMHLTAFSSSADDDCALIGESRHLFVVWQEDSVNLVNTKLAIASKT